MELGGGEVGPGVLRAPVAPHLEVEVRARRDRPRVPREGDRLAAPHALADALEEALEEALVVLVDGKIAARMLDANGDSTRVRLVGGDDVAVAERADGRAHLRRNVEPEVAGCGVVGALEHAVHGGGAGRRSRAPAGLPRRTSRAARPP